MQTNTPSKYWKFTSNLAACNTLESDKLIHANAVWMVIDLLMFAVSFLMSIAYAFPDDPSSLASSNHRYVVSKLTVIGELDQRALEAFVIVYACYKLVVVLLGATYAANAYTVWSQLSQTDGFSREEIVAAKLEPLKPVLVLFNTLQFIDLTILLVPATLLLTNSLIKLPLFFKLLSGVLLLTTPGELYVNNLITYDLNFVRSNMLQGRSYMIFVVRVLGLWTLAAFSELVKRDHRTGVVLCFNFCHMLLAVALISLLYRYDNNLHRRRYSVTFSLVLTLYFIESMLQTLFAIFSQLVNQIDGDYALLVCGPLVFFLLDNISQTRSRRVFEEEFRVESSSPDAAVFYIEQLYMAYLRQNQAVHKVNLIRSMCEHIAHCSNPYCLCFMLKTVYSVEVGAMAAKNSRTIYKEMTRDSRSNYRNGFILFGDLNAVHDLKENYTRETYDATYFSTSRSVRLAKRQRSETSEEHQYFIDLDTDYTFKMVIASLFSSIINRIGRSHMFETVLAAGRYLTYEYRNQISTLTLVYQYVHSMQYKQEISWYRDYLFQMLIQQSKRIWRNSEAEAKAVHIPGIDLSKVLDYRIKVHQLRNVIRDIIIDKIDVYNQLCERQIDYKSLVGLSQKVRQDIVKTSNNIETLLAIGPRNIKLTREAVVFEICVLEHEYVSAKLRQRYRESLIDMRTRVGSINSTNQKQRFSLYNASNIVVFAKHIDDTFRITRFTHNAVYLFGLSKSDLASAPLTSFMPTMAAVHHDSLVLAYLNGDSKSQAKGKLFVPVTASNGNTRSVMLLPKIELTFFDDVSVAALISVRSKNHWPMIYADKMSNIFSANKRAQKILETCGDIHSFSLFAIFPRLLRVFGKDFKGGEVVDMSKLESKAGESTTVKSSPGAAGKILHHARMIDQVVKDLVATVSVELFYFQAMKPISVQQGAGASDMDVDVTPTTLNIPWTEASTKKFGSMGGSIGATLSLAVPLTSEHRAQILAELNKILKVRMSVESHHYQKGIIFREIALESVQKTGAAVRQIYKLLALSNSRYLVDFMMVGPEDLVQFYRAAAIIHRLSRVTTGGNSMRRDLLTSAKGMSLNQQPLEQERQQFQIKVLTEAFDNQYEVEELDGIDVFNRNIKPDQSDTSIYAEEESLIKSGSVRDISVPEFSNYQGQKSVDMNNQLRQGLNDTKYQLQRNYEAEYVKKLVDELYECMYHKENFKRSLSPRLGDTRLTHQKDDTRVTQQKDDFLSQENVLSINDMDSISIDQDSHSEVKVEVSDPLKTFVAAEQPSTFLRSSSRRSVKETQDASLLRRAIGTSHDRLKYRPYLWMMLVSCVVLCALKLTFKQEYGNEINSVYTYETNVNLIANLLRPTGFVMKEAIKYTIRANLSINTSLLPYGDIVDASQLDYYTSRLILQLPEIPVYYDYKMNSAFSFLGGIPDEQISIFSLSYSLLNLFLRTIQIEREAKAAGIFVPNVSKWREISRIAQRIFILMMTRFEEEISSREQNMGRVLKYFIANYCMNVGIVVIVLVAMLYIFKSIDRQVSVVADKLLISNKVIFEDSLKMMAKNVIALGEEDPRERKEFRDEIIIHLKAIDQMGSEGSGLSTLRKTRRRRVKNMNPGGPNRPNTQHMNNISNFYNRTNKMRMRKPIVLLVLLVIASIPSVVNFAYQYTGYYKLLDMLNTSSATNLASSSSHFFASVLYRRLSFLVLNLPFDATATLYLQKTHQYMQNAKTVSDPAIMDLFARALVCNTSTAIMTSDQFGKCLFSSASNSDYTFFRGIHDIVSEADELLLLINGNEMTPDRIKAYFESEGFLRLDFQTFYLSSGMKILGAEYMELILEELSSQNAQSDALLVIFYLLLFLMCLFLTLVYIPRERRVWNEVQDLLLILNDDILNGIQLKPLFKIEL